MSRFFRNRQELMTYCAGDVAATHAVFNKLWPDYRRQFPSAVSLAGVLELGTSYLPLNNNWNTYLNVSDMLYFDMQVRQSSFLISLLRHCSDAAGWEILAKELMMFVKENVNF